jgi:hypothetical protein
VVEREKDRVECGRGQIPQSRDTWKEIPSEVEIFDEGAGEAIEGDPMSTSDWNVRRSSV